MKNVIFCPDQRKPQAATDQVQVAGLAVKKLNHRQRKCLNYQTPHKVYYQALRGAVAT